MKILYFSRGRGFGHCVVDLQIRNRLLEKFPSIDVIMASYGDGLRAMKQNGVTVREMDIELDEELTIYSYHTILSVIKEENPELILSHEMFYAVDIAKKLSIPSILITHWFFEQITSENEEAMALQDMFNSANEILMIDFPDFHIVPQTITSNISFVGPIVRPFDNSPENRSKIRAKFGLDQNIDLICLSLGGRNEESIFIAETTIKAFKKINDAHLGLIYMAGANFTRFENIAEGLSNVYIGQSNWNDFMNIQAASDFAITRGTFTTLCELATIGVPSLCITNDLNKVDVFHSGNFERIGTSIMLPKEQLSIDKLVEKIIDTRGRELKTSNLGNIYKNKNGLEKAVEIISKYL